MEDHGSSRELAHAASVKHTPGPWRVEGPREPLGEVNPNMGWWSVEGQTHIADHVSLYDACLIAAAPDLLEAAIAHIAARQALAETAVDSLAQDDPRFKAVADTLADLEAAIAKATREPT